MDVETARERIPGSLLAGAIGDALGAPVEFMRLREIRSRFGPSGVTGYLPAYGRAGGAITDDTQMTLFSADGLIRALVRWSHRGVAQVGGVVQRSYWRWLTTQGERWPARTFSSDGLNGWLLTASITGTILGTLHGATAIPESLLAGLELRDVPGN